jgi:hypothetical protein
MLQYLDNLPDLLNAIPPNLTTATVGICGKSSENPFHKGHESVIETALNTDSDFTMIFLLEYYDLLNYFFLKTSSANITGDKNYMINWLNNKYSIDFFYYCDIDDWLNNWMENYDKQDLLDWADEIYSDEGYFAFTPEMLKTWLIALKINNENNYLRRKYWVFSIKDDPFRIDLIHFCNKYTNFIPIMIDPVRGVYGGSYTSHGGLDDEDLTKKLFCNQEKNKTFYKLEDVNNYLKSIKRDEIIKCVRMVRRNYNGKTYMWLFLVSMITGRGFCECLQLS